MPAHELRPSVRTLDDAFDPVCARPFDVDEARPVHGTITVDVRHQKDRELLERLLRTKAVLSVTAADGWTQRLRLTAVRNVSIEEQPDGSSTVVATYSWLAAASSN